MNTKNLYNSNMVIIFYYYFITTATLYSFLKMPYQFKVLNNVAEPQQQDTNNNNNKTTNTTNTNIPFQCPLQKYQCIHVNAKTGHRCRRKQYIGFNVCYQHLATDYHLKIKASNIRGAGKGLFAYNGTNNDAIVFKKDERIIDYNAEIITTEEKERRYGDNTAPYAVRINENIIEDGACQRSSASIANNRPFTYSNAKFYPYQRKIYVKAIKNIRNNQEITIDYGDEYIMNQEGNQHETKYIRK